VRSRGRHHRGHRHGCTAAAVLFRAQARRSSRTPRCAVGTDSFSQTRSASHVAQEPERQTGYNPEKIRALALENPVLLASRTVQVAWNVGRLYLGYRLDEWLARAPTGTVKKRSREIREVLVELGPCYIKLGQALANRPDILRSDYMEELERLQDNVPPFPDSEALGILQEELGQGIDSVFSELSKRPAAAASLGQVYRGKLRKNGQEVAVKIQRPGLDLALSIDMYMFREFANLLDDWAEKNLGCRATLVVDEFGTKLFEESDYIVEAKNAISFAENFAEDPTVKIPQVFLEYTSHRVITMEWIDGVKCTNVNGLNREKIDIEAFIRTGVQASLRQLLEFGLFHGDPHAGNIFAMPDGRIAFVDFGNVARITDKQRNVMIGAITHVSNSDYDALANDFIRLGFLRPGSDVSDLVPAMAKVWSTSLGTSIQDFNFRTVTAGFSRLMYQFPMRVPERFSLVIRVLLTLEGICLCLNPDFSVIEVALPYASKRLLSDGGPSMRRELMKIVLKEEDGKMMVQWNRLIDLVSMAKDAEDSRRIPLGVVFVSFFRGFRRDLVADESSLDLPQVLQSEVQAVANGDKPPIQELQTLLDLLGPELKPELIQQLGEALLQDSLEDFKMLMKRKGLNIRLFDRVQVS